jgi:hypothetical protein
MSFVVSMASGKPKRRNSRRRWNWAEAGVDAAGGEGNGALPGDVANLLSTEMSVLEQEHLRVVLLNTRNEVWASPRSTREA